MVGSTLDSAWFYTGTCDRYTSIPMYSFHADEDLNTIMKEGGPIESQGHDAEALDLDVSPRSGGAAA
jgi:hypothetical protein